MRTTPHATLLVLGLAVLSTVFYARARGLWERIDGNEIAETFS